MNQILDQSPAAGVAEDAPLEKNSSANGQLALGALAATAVAAAALSKPAQSKTARSTRALATPLNFRDDIPGTGNIKVLNYALALEDLEADLYKQVLFRLRDGGVNALGTTIPGLNISTTQPDVQYVQEFLQVEIDHRDFLRAAITGAGGPVISPLKYDFDLQNKSRQQAMDLIYLAEKTGVGAYLGAIKYFTNTDYLAIAGAIQGTEARHTAVIAGVLRSLFGETEEVAPLANQNNGIDQPIEPDAVLSAVSQFIVKP